MKKITVLAALMSLFTLGVQAQNDTMYVMKDGVVINKQVITKSEVDSIIFYKPAKPTSGTFTDTRDGNTYKYVTIGNQVWMAENLKWLPSVVSPATGSNTTSYYYVYDYNGTDVNAAKATSNYATYGVLYNWTAAMNGQTSSTTNPSGIQGACPTGWHLPSDAEWTELTNYLGGESVAGGKLKEAGTTHWIDPNTGATNETGFTALPGGNRYFSGQFGNIGSVGFWWSATEYHAVLAWFRSMDYDDSNVYSYDSGKEFGFSVRCVRD